MTATRKISCGAWLICLAVFCPVAVSQTPEPPQPAPGMVALNFPENVDLKVLVDYVGQRQSINFLYDEQLASKRVTLKAPQAVPAEAMMTLLENILKMNGLVITKTDVPGILRIETAKQLTAISEGPGTAAAPGGQPRPTQAMTRIFGLKHANPQRIETIITPFLSSPQASLVSLPEHRLVIVTDYTVNMKRLEEMIAVVDRPRPEVVIRSVAIANQEAGTLAQKVTQLLAGKARAMGEIPKDAAGGVSVIADERSNQLAVVGTGEEVAQVVAMIQSLDAPLSVQTKVYNFAVASPDQVDGLVKKLIGEATAKRLYGSATDPSAGLLIATTTPEIHQRIESMRLMLDKPVAETQSPIRFYKLQNAKAEDVLTTLQNIEGDAGLQEVSVDGVNTQAPLHEPVMENPINGPGPEQVNAKAGRVIGRSNSPRLVQEGLNLKNARVMADEGSNTIIIIARPAMHDVYEKLIKRLDTRRPQVQVEATVVAIDTTNDFKLGVEISGGGDLKGNKGKYLSFSNFGLSTVDPNTGGLTLRPGIGFNGALISSDIADIVIHALETDKRVKVVSKPSILINDNATGTLLSENEEPYSSVNASTTVATTSFAGYSSAGTNISIKPQIGESDHLKLEYEITLSSFGETRTDSLPPSRQKNSLASEATIPNGHTIVVGGLTRESDSETIDRLPILGRIPGLEHLFSNRTNQKRQITIFVFIRAVILRDDQFADLKSITGTASGRAELAGDVPKSEPLEIR